MMIISLPFHARKFSQQMTKAYVVHRSYHEVSFRTPGNPEAVLEYLSSHQHKDDTVPDGSSTKDSNGEILARVEIHHAPWNPADVNLVQGKYPSPFPAGSTGHASFSQSRWFPSRTVAGAEGYGQVVDVVTRDSTTSAGDTKSVDEWKPRVGDWVTFAKHGVGTLRSSVWLPTDSILPIPHGSTLFTTSDPLLRGGIASLFQLGGTALGMLNEFVNLKPGDILLQNAGNSAVGIVASQLAHRKNVRVVSMVRRGNRTPNEFETMKQYIQNEGRADLVVAQEDLVDNKEAVESLKTQLKSLGGRPPMLAFNAVGGSASTVLMQILGTGGVHVSYGGMSMRPVTVATSHLIFKDISVRGYWQSRWMIEHNRQEKVAMVSELVEAFMDGQLKPPPVETFHLSKVSDALMFAGQQSNEAIRKKVIFDCREFS